MAARIENNKKKEQKEFFVCWNGFVRSTIINELSLTDCRC